MLTPSLPAFTWLNPTRVVFGIGELARLPGLIEEVSAPNSRVFLVTGRRSLREQGVLPRVIQSIGEERLTLFDQITPFPSASVVDTALAACRAAACQVVVAIGGGSVIDVAKLVAVLMAHEGSSQQYASQEKPLVRSGLPVIAVPTTSGSSSEVTAGAALWDWEAKRSMNLWHPLLFPAVALVDPELTLSMPKPLAAVTGMDALTSAFESYWSLESEPMADATDLEVIRLLARHLENSCNQGDIESRSWCALAATMSGIAYSNSHPNVCHAIGSPLTIFWEVSHGQAVGITLPTFLKWTAPEIAHKLPALWAALGVRNLNEAVSRIDQLAENCGLKTRLHDLGVRPEGLETLVEHTRWDRVDVLPRSLARQDLQGLLLELL